MGCLSSGGQPASAVELRRNHGADRPCSSSRVDPLAPEAGSRNGEQRGRHRDRSRRVACVVARGRRTASAGSVVGDRHCHERICDRPLYRRRHGTGAPGRIDDGVGRANWFVRQARSNTDRAHRRRHRMAAGRQRRSGNGAVRIRYRSAGAGVHDLLSIAPQDQHRRTCQCNRRACFHSRCIGRNALGSGRIEDGNEPARSPRRAGQ